MSQQLYDKVVHITYEYLGPAADRFVTRQIRNHLHKDPEDLRKEDLRHLIEWIGLAMALLSEDQGLVIRYLDELKALSKSGTKPRSQENDASSED